MSPDGYSLRPFTVADLPMLAVWLETPAVRQWWGDPAEQLALMKDDLDGPLMDRQIGLLGPQPIAYLQSCSCADWPAPQFADYPGDARAVDICLGVPDLIGRGHGAAILGLYARRLIATGAPAVVIDPDPDNEPAMRSCRRAGFRDRGLFSGEDGDPVRVLEFDPA